MIFKFIEEDIGQTLKIRSTFDSAKELDATSDVMSGVSVLDNKIKHLNKFRHACDEAGVAGDLISCSFSRCLRCEEPRLQECAWRFGGG